MESNPEKDSSVLGSLFQTVINDMRGSTPVWEDFTYKSMKLHSSLKTTVVTIGAFLEAFQKVADMATSSKGATREIGSALTRLCLRHRSIESHLKVLTSSIMDNLVAPLQEKLEDWKKTVAQLDKDHAKEYKKAKQEIKRAASDTVRLQKKVRKGSIASQNKTEMQHRLDSAMMEVNSKYHQLEETEKNSLRAALIEERSRFCHFITCLQPFVHHELQLLTEMSHIQEIIQSLCMQASDPGTLPASSEQVISDLKGVDSSSFNFSKQHQHSPPSSPSSLGSRKSSMCSINSINSSSSGSSKSHSPSHTMHKRTASQQPPPGAIRLTSVSSQDSGFTSQDMLFLRPNTPQSLSLYQASASTAEKDATDGDCDSTPTTPSDNTPSASSTWNNWPNLPGSASRGPDTARPHTISSAYEKGHNRPALKPDLFEPPQEGVEMRHRPARSMSQQQQQQQQRQEQQQHRPSATISKLQPVLPPHCPKPKVKAVAPPMVPPESQPIYSNMAELVARGMALPDTSPDDGEPTTPTTPASNPLAQPRRDGMEVLQAAMQEMTAATASLPGTNTTTGGSTSGSSTNSGGSTTNNSPDSDDAGSQEVTPRSSVDEPGGPDIDLDPLEVGKALARPKIQQDTSLELAKAIRELEASTAALTSAYDSPQDASFAAAPEQPPPIIGPPPPSQQLQQQEQAPPLQVQAGPNTTTTSNSNNTGRNGGGVAYDAESYTSKTSLQCSSGYGTMNSTPASSEDTIASGDCEGEVRDAGQEEEKYYTIPRSGEASAAFRAAFQPRRPASTAGLPVSVGGPGVIRRGSCNIGGQKPPPPVRRTSSVTGSTPAHVQKLRNSPPRQVSVDSAMIQQQHGYYPVEGYTDPGHGSNNYRPGNSHPAQAASSQSTVNVIQSLNAKFASLNSQYQEGNGYDQGPVTEVPAPAPAVKPPPPAVMQKPNKSGIPLPPSLVAQMQQQHQRGAQQHHQQQQQQHHHQQIQKHPHHKQQHPQHNFQQHHHHQKHHQHHHHQQQQDMSSAAMSNNHQHQQHHQSQQQHQQQYHHHHHHQQHQQQHSGHVEDFPLPPTEAELQEMERIYSTPQMRQPPAQKQVQPQHHHHHYQQQPQQHQQQPRPDPQASLMMELKRRVSVDDSSQA